MLGYHAKSWPRYGLDITGQHVRLDLVEELLMQAIGPLCLMSLLILSKEVQARQTYAAKATQDLGSKV